MTIRRAHERFIVLAALGVVAGAPFLLTKCTPAPSASPPAPWGPASGSPSISALAPAGTPPPSASAPPASSRGEPGAPSRSATLASEPPEPPTYKGTIPVDCPGIERALARARTLDCKLDADCTMFSGYCTCPEAAARSSVPKLRALVSAFERKECYKKGPPRPCPTCAPPPEPRCVSGTCG